MNIFRLHDDPMICARWHCDKHVVKMITEHCQLMSTAHHLVSSPWRDEVYKPTHAGHPSTKWVVASTANYIWLADLTRELCKEYTYRYGKTHKCQSSGLLRWLHHIPMLPLRVVTEFAQVVPDECKDKSPVKAYRNYYAANKSHILEWRGRPMPRFLEEYGYKAIEIERP